MQIKIDNKTGFINNFLNPVGKLTENTVIKVKPDMMSSISTSSDGTLIVSCNIKQVNDTDDTLYLNIPDINKLVKVLTCIEDDKIELTFNNNNIESVSYTHLRAHETS